MSSEPHHTPNNNPNNTSTTWIQSNRKILILSLVTIVIAVLIALFANDTANLSAFRRLFGSSSAARSAIGPLSAASASASASIAASTAVKGKMTDDSTSKIKTPVYFLSHGGVSNNLCIRVTESRYWSAIRVDFSILTLPFSLASCMTWITLPIVN